MSPQEQNRQIARLVEAELNRGSGEMWHSQSYWPKWEVLDPKVVEQNRRLLETYRP